MIRVTVTDTATGDVETAEIWDDYALITAGSCRQVSVGYDPDDPETQHITVTGVKRNDGPCPTCRVKVQDGRDVDPKHKKCAQERGDHG